MSRVPSPKNQPFTFIRDTVIATGVIVCLYEISLNVQFQWFQIPGYFLIIGFDILEAAFGSAGDYYYVLLTLYLVGLGLLSAFIAHRLREHLSESMLSWWPVGVSSALAVIGILSLLFGLFILIGTSQRTPILITTATSLVMFALAGWLMALGRRRETN